MFILYSIDYNIFLRVRLYTGDKITWPPNTVEQINQNKWNKHVFTTMLLYTSDNALTGK